MGYFDWFASPLFPTWNSSPVLVAITEWGTQNFFLVLFFFYLMIEAELLHIFTSGKSTVTNLLEALDVWTKAFSHNLPVDVLFSYYAKAFDTVAHERLETDFYIGESTTF